MNTLQKIGASLLGIKAYYAPGVTMMLGGSFSWNFKGKNGQLSAGYKNKIVYATVNVLVRKLIEAPIIVSKVKSQKDVQRLKNFNFRGGNEAGKYNATQLKALDEIEDHELIDLLNKPNDYQTGIEMREAFWFNYKLTGDGFLFVEKNGNKPVFIHCLPSDRVTIERHNGDWRQPVTKYKFNAWDSTLIDLPMENLMHLKKWSPLDPIQGGYSPMNAAGLTVEKNNQNDIAQGSIFVNGGTGTIISSETVIEGGKAHFKLDKTQVESIKKTIREDWTGSSNNGKFHVTNGTVKVDKIGDTLVDMNAIAADDQDAVRIAASWGVNSILIGDKTGGSENNVKVAEKQLVTNVVVSDLRKFDEKFREFSKTWYKGERLYIAHDLTEFSELAPDLKLMKEVYGDAWYLTGNEKRKLFNMDEVTDPNMGKFIVPSGFTPLDTLFSTEFDNLDPAADNL